MSVNFNDYAAFLSDLDEKLRCYFDMHKDYVFCRKGCSLCCEKGDYPVSQLELEYLMSGFISLDDEIKSVVKKNFDSMRKSETCPFLVNKTCSVYLYRPIVCRVHGLAYLCREQIVKLPYCANSGKNYSKIYKDGTIRINPIEENLDTPFLLKNFTYGEIRNLYDWIKVKNKI